jgi:hypothetical protein
LGVWVETGVVGGGFVVVVAGGVEVVVRGGVVVVAGVVAHEARRSAATKVLVSSQTAFLLTMVSSLA